MEDGRFELLIAPARDAVPVRIAVTKAITTIGSDPSAHVRLFTVPPQWAVIHTEPDALSVRLIASGERKALTPGESTTVDGVTLSCQRVASDRARSEALDNLASSLTSAESADAVLRLLLEGAIAAAAADTGAIIVTDEGAYRVAVAVDADGRVLDDAAELLSDTIVRDVLGTGERVNLTDVNAHERYAQIPSVVSLHLQSVLCLPMRVEGRTWGAVFLGKRDTRQPFSDRVVADLKVLASMAVPFLAQLRRAHVAAPASDELLGESAPMNQVRTLVRRVGPSDLSVLVLGASGTGKELVARAIHAASPRANRALIALNCASVPESLLGAELFGYKKGAFTGANTDRKGLIETADDSTLFLDEVGDMPLPMQAALLRVLEQREVKRLGETTARPVDFRLIAATNRDLAADVQTGRFREDLLFRLQELTIELPPLADRGDDVLLLAHFFLRQAESQLSLPGHTIGDEAEAVLLAHPWPGNARELRATMRRAAVLADDKTLRASDLRLDGAARTATPATAAATELGDTTRPLADARDEFVKSYVAEVVDRHGGNREAAAKALGIGVRTLYRYLA
jgi:transcriptional regulator with GAF, ATPase, and Fis domain